MNRFLKLARLHKLMDEANDGSGSGTSTGGGAVDEVTSGSKPDATKTGETDDKTKASTQVQDEVAKLLRETMQRKEEVKRLSGELTTAQAVLKQLEELGGLDSLKSLVTERRAAEEKQLEAKGEWERLKARIVEENQRALAEKDDVVKTLTERSATLERQINELTIGTAFSQSAFIRESLVLPVSKARVVYGEHFDLVDGQIVGYDKPRGAQNRTPLVDGTGNNLNFDLAIQKLVDSDPEKDYIIKSKVKAGAASETRRTQATQTADRTEVGARDKIKAGLGSLNLTGNNGVKLF